VAIGLGVIYIPKGMLRPPMSGSQSRHRMELKEQLLERDTHCRGCGKPLVQPLIHMHEGLISRGDVQGWPRKMRGQINVELNCVLLCPECNLGNATHHSPSRERVFSEHLELYGEDVLRWLKSLPFKAHPLKGLIERS